jgi:hypothetical protein
VFVHRYVLAGMLLLAGVATAAPIRGTTAAPVLLRDWWFYEVAGRPLGKCMDMSVCAISRLPGRRASVVAAGSACGRLTAIANRVTRGRASRGLARMNGRRRNMTAIDDLRAADCVRFAMGISYHLSAPIIGDVDRTTRALCITKPAGSLEMTLTSADLNLPVPGLSIPFTGVASGNTVVWSVDQALDITYVAHISRVRGTITTRVDETTPMLATNCTGAERVVKSTLTTIGSNNTLTVEIDVLADAVASNISFSGATCAQALADAFFNVRIRPNRSSSDGCGNHFQLEGASVRFSANVENFAGDGTITAISYSWSIPSGVTLHGATDRRNVDVTLDSPGSYTLTCTAIITTSLGLTSTQTSSTTFAVVTQEEAAQLSLFCELRKLARGSFNTVISGIGAGFTIGGHRFVDPLWDPVPDGIMHKAVLARGLTHHEALEVRAVAETLARTASALAKQSTLVIEQRERESKLAIEHAMKAQHHKPKV